MIPVARMNYEERNILVTGKMLEQGAIIEIGMTSEKPQYVAGSMVLLPRLSKQVMRRSRPESLGMDLRLLMALSYLGDHDGAPQQEFVDALCMDAKNVVLLLNELEDLGHVERRRDSEDR